MKKLKIFAAVGVFLFVLTGGLTIWLGFKALNFIGTKTSEAFQSPATLSQVENLKTELNTLPKLQALSCWNKTQSLFGIQPWLERPVMDNLAQLKTACLETRKTPCEGVDCINSNNLLDKTEGEFI